MFSKEGRRAKIELDDISKQKGRGKKKRKKKEAETRPEFYLEQKKEKR